MSPPIDFAVLGGNKCGTSALWKYSTSNPSLAWVGVFKENEYWANQIGKSSLCDNVIEVREALGWGGGAARRDYLTLAATQRRVALKQRPGHDVLVGDWASANLQCLCCPVSLKTINPDLKVRPSPAPQHPCGAVQQYSTAGTGPAAVPGCRLVVVLRDPVQRALSVFLTAKRATGTWWNEWTKNHTLASYVDHELASVRRCVDVARRFRNSAQTVAAIAGNAAAERARLLAAEAGGVQQQQHYYQEGAAAATAGRSLSAAGDGSDSGSAVLGGSGASTATSELAEFARRQHGQQAGAGGAAGGASSGGAISDAVPHGWGGGMDLSEWMEAQCYAQSHLLGWSAYDVFLSNYLAHFPPRQLLVLYASQLAAQPAAVMARLEAHLGAPPGNYTRLGAVAANMAAKSSNSMRECLGWHCALKSEQRPLSGAERAAAAGGFSEAGSSTIAASGGGATGGAASSPFARAVAALAEFYAPHVARLVRWGREGRISPPPTEWSEAYGLDRHR
ncbi:hypothetical protein HXX76_006179 [Chlamydomonas incerta]|uniref:Sulfotransferase n=1 Tax=Chlamydomonas incerta TaxID=51695 RepID=A0A835T3G8_CHLIN|nr:hypothetical protein HXX76_006179 [Chlamydomonas incerta]|eukprot:KAG2436651.1 hypothetical protein HXX76_006179 [Chlamydomonas incerta]